MGAKADIRRMDADSFIEWAMAQPSGRYELYCGKVVAMAPERAVHAETKLAIAAHLRAECKARGLGCQTFGDGMALRIDARTVFEPDVSARCGPSLPGEATELVDPVIVVEVLSPSGMKIDTGIKLGAYFGLPSLRPYLIVDPMARTVIHHQRGEGDAIATRLVRAGDIALDPPGLVLPLSACFED